jgi:hypothetical protein
MKLILQPIPEWILGIGILGSIYMQAEINTNQQVTEVTKLIFPVGDQKESQEYKHKRVLQEPVRHIRCAEKGINPDKKEESHKGHHPIISA